MLLLIGLYLICETKHPWCGWFCILIALTSPTT